MGVWDKLKHSWNASVVSEISSITPEGAFVVACTNLYNKHLTSNAEMLEVYTTNIDDYTQKLIELRREREMLLLRQDQLETIIQSKNEWAKKEYGSILALPHVKNISLHEDTLSVFTDMITINHHSINYNIGEFRIDINIKGKDIKAHNLTCCVQREGRGYFHPHIKGNGECCLGNLSEGIIKLLADYEFVVIVQMMIAFLHSYNPGSPYVRVEKWNSVTNVMSSILGSA